MTSYYRAPELRFNRMIILTIILFLLLFVLVELLWKVNGYAPNIEDDYDLWSLKRGAVYENNAGKNLVLVGASRIRANISEQVLHASYPDWNIVNLAIVGKHPLAVLENLANDELFIGDVFVSVWPRSFLPENYSDQKSYVDHYEKEWGINKELNKLIALQFQSHLSLLNTNTNIIAVIRYLIQYGKLPPPYHVSIDKGRYQAIDFAMINAKLHRKYRESRVKSYYEKNRIMSPDEWLLEAEKVLLLADKIRTRGGDVVFIRMPTTGETIKYDQLFYPKSEYWDRFTALYDRRSIHFMDYPTLMAYDLPDTSHLDLRDRVGFTRDLINIIRQSK